MSLDATEYKDRAYNAYFFAAVMSLFAVGGVTFYVSQQQIAQISDLSKYDQEQIESITRASRFNSVACSFENYKSDIFLRKVTNQFDPIDESYVPSNLVTIPFSYRHPLVGELTLRQEVVEPTLELIDAARLAGFNLKVNSSYRSHARQREIYDLNTDVLLITKPEKAARPGFSEHQLGTAVDISQYPSNSTAGYDWLAQNAPEFGFVLSYPENKETITEFRHEPWHWRYVGVDLARYVSNNDVLFNHEKSVLLPSPTEELTELPYEYTGRDLWIWKSLGGDNEIQPVVQGDTPVEYVIDIEKIIALMKDGTYDQEQTNITLPIRNWILESQTEMYLDTSDKQWLRTTFASPKEDQIVERLEILYRDDLGYIAMNFQDQNFSDRFVTEITDSCGYMFKKDTADDFLEPVIEEEELS